MSVLASIKLEIQARANSSPLVQRWMRLPSRDRASLKILGLFIACVMFYLVIWLPAERRLERAESDYRQQHALFLYLQKNQDKAREVAKSSKTDIAPEHLQGEITQSAQKHRVSIESFDNDGASGVSLSLKKVELAKILAWLAELEGQGISLGEIEMNRAGEGVVDVSLKLAIQ